jgi:hypothetical protein
MQLDHRLIPKALDMARVDPNGSATVLIGSEHKSGAIFRPLFRNGPPATVS